MKSHVKKAYICLLLALLLLPWGLLSVAKAEAVPGEVTASCSYALPENVPVERLTDHSLLTRLTIRSQKKLTVSLPACGKPSLYVTWFARPRVLTVTQLNAGGKQIAVQDVSPAAPFERYELDPACRQAVLTSGDNFTISTLRVFDGDLPQELPWYGAPLEQADLLVILGQPQALFEELGGLVPLYTGVCETKTAFCFLNEDSAVKDIREAGDPRPLGEALTALWSLGYTEAPFLGGFLDHDYNELEDVQKSWLDKDLEEYLVRLIRTLKPKIVVCAAGGEEDQRSAYAASQIEKIVTVAANGGKYAEVGKAHKVQKLYVSDPAGQTVVSYAGVSEAAAAAYEHVASRQFYKRALPREGRFPLRNIVGSP